MTGTPHLADHPTPNPGFPRWTKSGLNVTNGRDPLALETITANQIMPILLPGVVVLSRRARYMSFSLFLLDEFHRRGGTEQGELGRFVRGGEFDLLLAVRQCERLGCGGNAPATVGYFAVQAAMARSDGNVVERGESVEGTLGGYGQQYRSLLIALGLIAERGMEYEEKPLRMDRITTRGRPIADAFRRAVESTQWYQEFLGNDHPIPLAAVRELSEAACLCRLRDTESERALIDRAMFGEDSRPSPDEVMRRRGFALSLGALASDPGAERDEGVWRQYIWDRAQEASGKSDAQADAAAAWGAMVAKEWYQQALATMWSNLSAWGRANQAAAGFTPGEVRKGIRSTLAGPGETFGAAYGPEQSAEELSRLLQAALATRSLESLQRDAVKAPYSATDGLALLLVLLSRLPVDMPPSWEAIGRQRSFFQPGVLTFCGWLKGQLERGVTVADLLENILVDRVLTAHDRVASDRLPNFIFRWRFENGRWRFLSQLWSGPFALGGSRHEALVRLSQDLDLWARNGDRIDLTTRGRTLVELAWK